MSAAQLASVAILCTIGAIVIVTEVWLVATVRSIKRELSKTHN